MPGPVQNDQSMDPEVPASAVDILHTRMTVFPAWTVVDIGLIQGLPEGPSETGQW